MKNFLSLENLELKPNLSIKSFISASSEIKGYPIANILQEDKNIWLSEEFLPQEIILNFRNIKLKEHPKKLTAIGIYCSNKNQNNPKIVEVLISKEIGNNFLSLGHFDLSYKAGRQLIYLDDENDIELEEVLNTVNFNSLIIKLIIKETFGGKNTYINNLYLYDNIDTDNINPNTNMNINNNIDMNLNPNSNNQYMYIDDNNDNNDNANELNNIIDINDLNNEIDINNKNLNMNNLQFNNNSPLINNNQNQELINNNIDINDIKNFEENLSPNGEEDISSDYKSKTMTEKFSKKRMKSSRGREHGTKTPKIFKKYANQEDRPMPENSLSNRIINTTVRQYNNKNMLEYEMNNNNNNSINNIINGQYNNINNNGQNKLNQLINEFRNYRENQESIMNNYENRVKLLEDKCNELKNTMKKMNATMNTIIESQYSQSQASNDNLLKECQNMINEAIVNVLSNMGSQNMESYSLPMPPIYPNYPMNMKKIRNMNNNMFFNNYNSIPTGRNSANYMYNNNFRKETNFNNMYINEMNNNMNNVYNDNNMDNYIYDNNANENGQEDNNIHDENDGNDNYTGAEYLEQEIKNMENEQLNNNLTNENYDNMDYFENDNNIDNNINVGNNIIEVNNINENNIINNNTNNINEKNNDAKTVKSLHSNDLYNDGLIPYEERIRSNPKKYSNLFSKSTNNYRVNKTNIITRNNNTENNNQPFKFNSEYESRPIKALNRSKNNSNSNIFKPNNQYFTEPNENANNKTYLIKTSSRLNIKKHEKNKNNNDEVNKDLSSSDNSIDNIKINTNITESILKPTLEKFENYMSLNNNNNFGRSQSVYSANSLNTKKEVFGGNLDKEKEIKGKNKDDDNDSKKKIKKKENKKNAKTEKKE